MFKSFGIVQTFFMFSRLSFQLLTSLTIDHHLFFFMDNVTASSDFHHEIDILEILVIFLGDSFTSAISFKYNIQESHFFQTIIFSNV
jgi:hypothetical protein